MLYYEDGYMYVEEFIGEMTGNAVCSVCEFWYVIRALDEIREEIEFAMMLETFRKIPIAKRYLPSRISFKEDNVPAPSPEKCPRSFKFASYGWVPLHMVWLCDASEAYKYIQLKSSNVDGTDIAYFNDLLNAYKPLYDSMSEGL